MKTTPLCESYEPDLTVRGYILRVSYETFYRYQEHVPSTIQTMTTCLEPLLLLLLLLLYLLLYLFIFYNFSSTCFFFIIVITINITITTSGVSLLFGI